MRVRHKAAEWPRRRRMRDTMSLPRVVLMDAAIVALAISGALPSTSWALCPNCLGQARALTPTMELLGVFLLVPFVVFLVVLRVIRRAGRL